MKDLALHIMDVMQNSIAAESSCISVGVETTDEDRMIEITVEDNGCGMDDEILKTAADPFHTSRKTRTVGLGIPMFKEAAIATGGDFSIESEKGKGTTLKGSFVNGSIDRQPLGDLGNVFFLTMLSYEDLQLKLKLSSSRGSFFFDSKTLAADMEQEEKDSMEIAAKAESLINSQVTVVFQNVLSEIGGELYDFGRNFKIDQG